MKDKSNKFNLGDTVNYMKDFDINPEILSREPTHTLNSIKVKVFYSTRLETNNGTWITFEVMEGPSTGRWGNVNFKYLMPVEDLELKNFKL